jgi:hypothetical protein
MQEQSARAKFKIDPLPMTVLNWFTSNRIIALATIVYAVVTIRMFFAIRSQAKAAHRQADIAEKAANAAKLSADSLINVERAWVMLNLSLKPDELRNRPKVPRIVGLMKNFGKSPAWITESSICFERCSPEYVIERLKYATASKMPNGEPVPPGDVYKFREVELEPSASLPHSDFLLFGYIKYKDIFFDKTKEIRETYFCLRYRITDVEYMTDREGRWFYDGPAEANRHS